MRVPASFSISAFPTLEVEAGLTTIDKEGQLSLFYTKIDSLTHCLLPYRIGKAGLHEQKN